MIKKKGVRSDRIVVPNILVPKLLELAHDVPLSGHLGYKKTIKGIESHFCWPRFYRSVRSYIRSCYKCQRLDKTHSQVKAPLHPLPIVEEPFSRLIMDVVGPLPECSKSGNRFILTLMDNKGKNESIMYKLSDGYTIEGPQGHYRLYCTDGNIFEFWFSF